MGISSRGRTERARIVIGADGLGSLVARSVGAPVYHDAGTLTCAYYSYWSGVEMDGVELYPRSGRMIVAAPTNDDQVIVVVFWPRARFHAVRADVERHFLEALELAPGLAERVRGGTRTDRFRGSGRLPNLYRRPYGDGWALVGDAGHHKDPILALGITDAFRDAELLAEAIETDDLPGYERRRNDLSAHGFHMTLEFARLAGPTPAMQELLVALRDDAAQRDRFFGVMAGTVAPDELTPRRRRAAPSAAA